MVWLGALMMASLDAKIAALVPTPPPIAEDWLVSDLRGGAGVFRGRDSHQIVLSNGLVARTFLLAPDAATVGIRDLSREQEFLRGPAPEAVLEIGGRRLTVGGLAGQQDFAFLRSKDMARLHPGESSAQPSYTFQDFEVGKPAERLEWKRVRHAADANWPPAGVALTLWFGPHGNVPDLRVGVHYELYDGMPIFSKWLTIENRTGQPVRLASFSSELLRAVEAESVVDSNPAWRLPPITVATDYSFGGMAVSNSNRTVYWEADPEYKTQVNYERKTPCFMQVRPPLGPDADIAPGSTFRSFTAFELFHDSTERERQGLGVRRMFRSLAPWCTENPLMLHLTSTDPNVVHNAIDQAAECGFEMVVISFWSGLDMEDVSPQNIAKFREFREYANRKGVELGGYSLLASRHIDEKNDVVNPTTGKIGGAIFGNSPCLCSEWGEKYLEHIKRFISDTGFQLLENDGSYPGDVCASTTHPGHRGLTDSQWMQYARIADLYRWCRSRGVYLNVPDNYFFAGSNKTGMGYREENWSLPRELQHIHARQNLYDGTWEKTPSMGWMMVPLVEYHGGGPVATLEPLHEHLQDYELHLANNLGYGAQACYRGPRLYDTPATKAAVVKWVSWFKKHREILESDVIHVRRPDGSHLDCVLHVNPRLNERAMAVVYNPGEEEMEDTIRLPLYYSGLSGSCSVRLSGGRASRTRLDSKQELALKVRVPGRSCAWCVIGK